MSFELYEIQWPEATHGVFDGACTVQVNSVDFLVLWKENKIFICDLKDGSSVSVITVRDYVKSVLQVKSEICYLNSSGTVYIIKPSDSCSENEDIFELTDDGNRTLNYFRNASCTYLFAVKDAISIHSIESGFVLAKKRGSDVYIDVHKVCGDFITIQCSFSVKLENVSCVSSVSVAFSSYKREQFSAPLRKILFGSVLKKDVDIVFISVCGNVYYMLVTSQGQCVERPSILYESSHNISEVMCLPKLSDSLYHYVAIILTSGPIVLISSDTKSKTFQHDLVFLPGDVFVASQVGKYIITGNGVDLWQCSLKLSEDKGLSVVNSLLGIKGVMFVNTFAERKKIVVGTLHNTFYIVSIEVSPPSVVQSSSKQDLLTVADNICRQLEQVAECNKKIAWEDGLIASLNIALRSGNIKNIFSEKIEVFDVNSMSIGCFLSHSVDIGDIEELLNKNVSVNNSYVIKMTLTNQSGIDFFPSVWFIQMSISVDNRTTYKTKELPQNSLSQNIPYNISICTQIKNFSNIKLSCNLIGMLPKGELYNTSPVWLKIPICCKLLDIGYFLQARYCQRFQLIKDNLLSSNVKHIKPRFLSHLVEESKVSSNKTVSYTFTFKNSTDANSVWSGIVKRCLLLCNKETEGENKGDIISMSCGSQNIDVKLQDTSLVVSCDSALLNLIKNFVMDGIGKSGSGMQINENILTKAVLIHEKLKVQQIKPDNFTLFEMKNVWRLFVQDNLMFL